MFKSKGSWVECGLMLGLLVIFFLVLRGTLVPDPYAKQLERIAQAQERQAKSLESIERWCWEPGDDEDPEAKVKTLRHLRKR